MSKILLLGASGYIGQAFGKELALRSCEAIPLARAQVNYCDFNTLRGYIRDELGGVDFLINAAGYTGQSSIDQCEIEKDATLRGNLLLPQMLSNLAAVENFLWLQVGTGCLYGGIMAAPAIPRRNRPIFAFPRRHATFTAASRH